MTAKKTIINSQAEIQLALTRAALRHACILLVRSGGVQPDDQSTPLNEEERLQVEALTVLLLARSINIPVNITGGAA